jgi:hypothetical protein
VILEQAQVNGRHGWLRRGRLILYGVIGEYGSDLSFFWPRSGTHPAADSAKKSINGPQVEILSVFTKVCKCNTLVHVVDAFRA